MAATIKDIARETRLGFATISRYLNGKRVKKVNQQKIEAVIKTLDYTINEYARGLRSSGTKTAGLIIPKIDDLFASALIANAQKFLTLKGYTTILATSYVLPAGERKAVEFLISRKVDGIIAIPIYPPEGNYEKAYKRGIPVVFLDSNMNERGSDDVYSDNYKVGRLAAETFISKGHTSAAVVCAIPGAYTSDCRLKGFCDAFGERGITIEDGNILRGYTDEDAGYHAAGHLLSRPNPPAAVFAVNYDLTIGIISALNEKRMELGKDLSLIGVDNLSITKIYRPRITLITQNYEEIAKNAVDILLERIEKTDSRGGHSQRIIDVALIEGDSVRDIRAK